MDEERLQVLQMVADGRISPDQANELLDALAPPAPPRPAFRRERRAAPAGEERRRNDRLRAFTEARMHGVDEDYIHEMRAAGFDLPLRDLMDAKIHGVNADFVREMRDAGFSDLSLRELTEAKIHGVNAGYIRAMSRYIDEETVVDDGNEDER